MSTAVQPSHAPTTSRLRRGLAGGVFLLIGGLAWWWLTTHHFTSPGHGTDQAKSAATAAAGAGIVTLPAGTAGEIHLATASMREMKEQLTVPGRLDYDARHRLDYGSPVDGIVSRVFVQVRQKVTKGDSLAEVSSPDVGAARDEVRKRRDDREIEKKASDWADDIARNVSVLLELLESHPPLESVERQFEGKVLGSYREKILGAYSRLLYVEKVNASTKQLGEGGVLSGRIIEERTSNLEVAKASFKAACEEAKFMTAQDRDRARAGLEQAERLVKISKEHLRTLVGSRLDPEGDDAAGGHVADVEADDATGGVDALSTLALRTPFDGLVEDVFVARGERVKAGDRMFVVADTSILWVRAQINERQWTTVEVSEGQEVKVTVPGSAEHNTTARISHVGAMVEAESRSVPLVAELQNDDAHYKPGMFVRVEIPQGKIREGLAVPAGAVMRHSGKSFVFVPEAEGGGFRKVDVETGVASDDFVEITSGLQAGQQVVTSGAFILKSELLLEDEG